jgi:hypothetical protein
MCCSPSTCFCMHLENTFKNCNFRHAACHETVMVGNELDSHEQAVYFDQLHSYSKRIQMHIIDQQTMNRVRQ